MRGWFPETDTCKCGHERSEHGKDGKCSFWAQAIPVSGTTNMVRQPDGTCYCKSFDGEPWEWVVAASYGGDAFGPCPDKPDWQQMRPDAKPRHYEVRKQGHHKKYGPYKTEAAAERRCDELNRELAQGPFDPEFKERRNRLKRVAPDFGGCLYEGPPGARWPIKPERYLLIGYADGWHGDSWTELMPTLAAVREALEDAEGNEIERVVDLDTGRDVAFERTISVTI